MKKLLFCLVFFMPLAASAQMDTFRLTRPAKILEWKAPQLHNVEDSSELKRYRNLDSLMIYSFSRRMIVDTTRIDSVEKCPQ